MSDYCLCDFPVVIEGDECVKCGLHIPPLVSITDALYRKNEEWWKKQRVYAMVGIHNRVKENIPAGTVAKVIGKYRGLEIRYGEVWIKHVSPTALKLLAEVRDGAQGGKEHDTN